MADPRAQARSIGERIIGTGFGDLFVGLITQESGFQNLTSPAGAMGYAQLMPATARELGVRDPWNPTENMEGGARYLRQMLDFFDGDVEKAVAAYNAGPGRVQNEVRVRGANWKSGLPGETQTYLQKVYEPYGSAGGRMTSPSTVNETPPITVRGTPGAPTPAETIAPPGALVGMNASQLSQMPQFVIDSILRSLPQAQQQPPPAPVPPFMQEFQALLDAFGGNPQALQNFGPQSSRPGAITPPMTIQPPPLGGQVAPSGINQVPSMTAGLQNLPWSPSQQPQQTPTLPWTGQPLDLQQFFANQPLSVGGTSW